VNDWAAKLLANLLPLRFSYGPVTWPSELVCVFTPLEPTVTENMKVVTVKNSLQIIIYNLCNNWCSDGGWRCGL